MNAVFDELDLRLSVVKRWGIIHTIQTQSVAEHSFNVAIIANNIAREWFGINDVVALYDINMVALGHDRSEALTGDIPSIVKQMFDGDELEDTYPDLLPDNYVGAVEFTGGSVEVALVIKLADLIEASVFLRIEESMGNRSVVNVRRSIDNHTKRLIMGLNMSVVDTVDKLMHSLFPFGEFVANDYDRRPKACS